MKPAKHGKKWQIVYWISGYPKPFSERFDTESEAKLRCAEIELAKENGTLAPPIKREHPVIRSMSDLLDEFVESYGITHWSESYLSCSKHRIEHYIKPYLGNYLVRDITVEVLDIYYSDLLTKPAVAMKGHKKTGNVSFDVMEKCHSLIRSALNMAVRWNCISSNPAAFVILPKKPQKEEQRVWSPETALQAIRICEDPILKLCIQLSIAGSLRIGEILGLQWKHVHVSKESIINNDSYIEICQELKRCNMDSLAQLEEKNCSDVHLKFPSSSSSAKSILVLKDLKTLSSIRRVYLPGAVATALMEEKIRQFFRRKSSHVLYKDYDLVIAQNTGMPYETRSIDRAFAKLIEKNHLPKVVFHSLRHLSASLKLEYSNGDIKAVQADTGHSQAKMVMQVYSHTFNKNRKRMASLMEENFFTSDSAEVTPSQKSQQIVALLEAKPELTDLILALTDQLPTKSA